LITDENEETNKTNIESLHKKRHFLSAYCKLIVYNIVPVRHAACVIKHYVKVSHFKVISKPFQSHFKAIF
jgi:cohesin complex subunit SA-1/2